MSNPNGLGFLAHRGRRHGDNMTCALVAHWQAARNGVYAMPRMEFKEDTLEDCRQALERWKRDHPGVTITKQHTPVEILFGGEHFLSKEKGPGVVIGAVMIIDYEDSNPAPIPAATEQTKT